MYNRPNSCAIWPDPGKSQWINKVSWAAANKRLGDVLQIIQAKQQKRDEKLLANKFVTVRRKKQIRAARAQADAPPGDP